MNHSAKNYWLLVSVFVLFELLSWTVFYFHALETVTFWAVLAAALVIGIRRLDYLAYVTVAELVLGSKGYLLFTHIHGFTLSLRIGLFLVLGVTWLWHQWKGRLKNTWSRAFFLPLAVFIAWVGFSTILGLARHRPALSVYQDMNAYLYLGVAWFWLAAWRGRAAWRSNVLTILLAGATVVGMKSWLMMALFGHNVPGLLTLYHWIRDTGVGEIALIGSQTYRVFFQSQIYCLIAVLVVLGGFISHRAPRWWAWALLWSSVGLYISLSRSFLIGLVLGITTISLYLMTRHQAVWLRRWWIILPLSLWAWLMMSWAINFPLVINPSGLANAGLAARLHDVGFGQASTARLNQIRPLWQAIKSQPVFGSGFGATVTYLSTDPRVHGWRTTSAFELGYLDMWLKLGAVGLGLFGWWLWSIWRRLRQHPDAIFFVGSLVAVLGVHLTSPYLNHPLGLGWLVIISLSTYDRA
ncbi:MAG: hypothetical protein HY092_01590 [Candidatus Kerfeldbacteria bacterium]|nr:hypothetical protein [Candidatus Kerfeldbacteria bacterium]